MANHQWSMLCGKALTDSTTNNISLIEVLEEFAIPVNPTVDLAASMPTPALLPFTFALVSVFARTDPAAPEKRLGRVKLLRPNGSTSFPPSSFDIDLTQFLRTRCVLGINGLPVHEA